MGNFDFDTKNDFEGLLSKKWGFIQEQNKPKDVIPMWIADMDFKTSPYITNALEKRSSAGIFGYAQTPQSYFDAVTNWYKKEHNWSIDPKTIVQITGIVPALHIAVAAFSKEGDNILLQTPVYHPFYRVVNNMKRKIIENPMIRHDDYYEIDFVDLENKLKEYKPKLMLVCNPQNPVGKTFTKEELTRIGKLCLKYNVITAVDEIHSDIVYSDSKHIAYGTLDKKFVDNAIICTAPSKTFNIAGLRNSNIIIPSESLRKNFITAKDYFGYPGVGPFPLIACEAAYRHGKEWKDSVINYIQGNRDYAIDFIKQNLPNIAVHKPQGTYFLWLGFEKYGYTDRAKLEDMLLNKAKLWLNQGYIFGTAGESYARMNIACPRSTLEQALKQLKDALV